MRRGYTRDQFLRKVDQIRNLVPDTTLTTDLIVGFPGETEKDFADSMDILNKVKFDKVHVAAYSERKGTFAFRKIEDDIPKQEKRRRLNTVNELQEKIQLELNKKFLSKDYDVLVEGTIRNKIYGRSEGDKLVYLQNYDESYIGKMVKTKIIDVSGWSLTGAKL
jgi:tRNA-2-methylthio-N6-dimethylallyladenosine synthase